MQTYEHYYNHRHWRFFSLLALFVHMTLELHALPGSREGAKPGSKVAYFTLSMVWIGKYELELSIFWEYLPTFDLKKEY